MNGLLHIENAGDVCCAAFILDRALVVDIYFEARLAVAFRREVLDGISSEPPAWTREVHWAEALA